MPSSEIRCATQASGRTLVRRRHPDAQAQHEWDRCRVRRAPVDRLLAQSWTLPEGMALKDTGPRTYRFIVDHTVTDTTGQVVQRQRVSGDYTRGLPGGDAVWSRVTVAESNGPAEISGPGQKREFMEGFRYRPGPASLDKTMKPDFFKGFPPTAVFERNLVWDTGMIEMFGQDQFQRLKLNVPLPATVGAGCEHARHRHVPESRRAAHLGWTVPPEWR